MAPARQENNKEAIFSASLLFEYRHRYQWQWQSTNLWFLTTTAGLPVQASPDCSSAFCTARIRRTAAYATRALLNFYKIHRLALCRQLPGDLALQQSLYLDGLRASKPLARIPASSVMFDEGGRYGDVISNTSFRIRPSKPYACFGVDTTYNANGTISNTGGDRYVGAHKNISTR